MAAATLFRLKLRRYPRLSSFPRSSSSVNLSAIPLLLPPSKPPSPLAWAGALACRLLCFRPRLSVSHSLRNSPHDAFNIGIRPVHSSTQTAFRLIQSKIHTRLRVPRCSRHPSEPIFLATLPRAHLPSCFCPVPKSVLTSGPLTSPFPLT